jgi:hypothetical protein
LGDFQNPQLFGFQPKIVIDLKQIKLVFYISGDLSSHEFTICLLNPLKIAWLPIQPIKRVKFLDFAVHELNELFGSQDFFVGEDL